MREFQQKIVILLEPRISGAMTDTVCVRLGKKRWARSEAMGFSGGVWVLLDEEKVELKLTVARRSFLHMEVWEPTGECWLLTAVYANPHLSIRRYIWEQLGQLKDDGAWMLVGDFNCVLEDAESSSKS